MKYPEWKQYDVARCKRGISGVIALQTLPGECNYWLERENFWQQQLAYAEKREMADAG
jgi:hypothetical protein